MAVRGSRLRFELGRLEVAGVVVGTAAGLFVVFLLGIYAGRGMAQRRLELDEALVRLPVDTAKEVPRDEDDLTFYETLTRDAADDGATLAHASDAGTAGRLQAVVSGATVDEPARAPEKSAARVAMAIVAEPPLSSGGEWSVQVAATRDPRHAESIKRQLTTAGYTAYIVKIRRQGETFHRVRVGHYASIDEARQVASLLRHQPGVTGAFVTSD